MGALSFKVFPNLYKDSVTLMQLSARLRGIEGVQEASCLMATPANLAQLEHAGLVVQAQAGPSDLLVVVRGEEAACAEALEQAGVALLSSDAAAGGGAAGAFELPLTSIALVVQKHGGDSGADLALISVPGDYAAAEAMKALALGLHVMLFSDNVSVAEERALKTFAASRELLVMGPDCGTAIVNGVPLGFANVVRRGDIGLVAASGTGLQEVTCRIHHLGGGVSQALGTGGRDLKAEIGGISMLQGLRALAADAATRVIVLVSKPPAAEVAHAIETAALAAGKPVVVHFLGAMPDGGGGLVAAGSLREAADMAVALARGEERPAPVRPADADLAAVEAALPGMAAGQTRAVGLFAGGTFCYEAQLAFAAAGLRCRSNAPAPGALPCEAGQEQFGEGEEHLFLDLGEDEYTRGRPHPMIDPEPRDAMLARLAADARVAVILFDLVLGYGAHDNPAEGLAQALAAAQQAARAAGRRLLAIGHVCGTEADPQDRAAQVARLQTAGAMVVGSNIEAAMLAAQVCARRGAPVRGGAR